MAQNFIANTTVQASVGSLSTTLQSSVNNPPSGSNMLADSQTINAGSWQTLATGSLPNVRYAVVSNTSTGSCTIATGSAGQNVLSTLGGGDFTFISWLSGSSLPLYANAATTPVTLQYVLINN